jgi:hypothetical protein
MPAYKIKFYSSFNDKSPIKLTIFLQWKGAQKMPPKGSSTKQTTHFKMPTKSDGTKDKRFTMPQFTKADGTRDLRVTTTAKRK